MSVLQSNSDVILVAIPMVAILFAGVFRLDELFGRSRKPKQVIGRPLGLDPDGKPLNAKGNKR